MSVTNEHGHESTISVIIPTLNEVENIKYVFPYIPQFIDEIVVIDGGSTDGTIEEILKFRKDAKIVIDRTPGKGVAIRTGFKKATGDIFVMMDADGSHDPQELFGLINPVLNGYDVAKGSRFLPEGGSEDITLFRRFGNKVFITLVNTMYGSHYTDLCYGYFAFKKEAIKKMSCVSDGFEIETEQSIHIIKAGLKIKEVPSFEARRKCGVGRLNSFRDGWRILMLIMSEYLKDIQKDERG